MKENSYLYEEIRKIDHDELRPLFHFTAPVGWINDPNGLIRYRDYYQLYYQYYPYAPHWDNMHWGHARSKDGLHWEDMPIAMKPDHAYDKTGVFSGSAIEKNGKLYVLYTGHVDEAGQVTETQCVAISDDGVDFKKYEHNPVMTVDALPGKTDPGNFRDPKVFKHGDKYYCVVAAALEGHGSLVLFESSDLLNWNFKSVLLQGEKYGVMTECPDYFNLNGQDYLAFSVILGDGRNSVVYLAKGHLDWKNFTFELEVTQRLDDGDDFYASQSFVNEKGERIVIPWLRSVDHINYLEESHHLWNGMMGIPRKLTTNNRQLSQKPIGQIKDLSLTDNEEIDLGSYRLTEEIPIDRSLVLQGSNGEIQLTRTEEDQYLIKIHSPVFIKTISWHPDDHHLTLVIDNSSLELFGQSKTLSIVTFVAGINRVMLKDVK